MIRSAPPPIKRPRLERTRSAEVREDLNLNAVQDKSLAEDLEKNHYSLTPVLVVGAGPHAQHAKQVLKSMGVGIATVTRHNPLNQAFATSRTGQAKSLLRPGGVFDDPSLSMEALSQGELRSPGMGGGLDQNGAPRFTVVGMLNQKKRARVKKPVDPRLGVVPKPDPVLEISENHGQAIRVTKDTPGVPPEVQTEIAKGKTYFRMKVGEAEDGQSKHVYFQKMVLATEAGPSLNPIQSPAMKAALERGIGKQGAADTAQKALVDKGQLIPAQNIDQEQFVRSHQGKKVIILGGSAGGVQLADVWQKKNVNVTVLGFGSVDPKKLQGPALINKVAGGFDKSKYGSSSKIELEQPAARQKGMLLLGFPQTVKLTKNDKVQITFSALVDAQGKTIDPAKMPASKQGLRLASKTETYDRVIWAVGPNTKKPMSEYVDFGKADVKVKSAKDLPNDISQFEPLNDKRYISTPLIHLDGAELGTAVGPTMLATLGMADRKYTKAAQSYASSTANGAAAGWLPTYGASTVAALRVAGRITKPEVSKDTHKDIVKGQHLGLVYSIRDVPQDLLAHKIKWVLSGGQLPAPGESGPGSLGVSPTDATDAEIGRLAQNLSATLVNMRQIDQFHSITIPTVEVFLQDVMSFEYQPQSQGLDQEAAAKYEASLTTLRKQLDGSPELHRGLLYLGDHLKDVLVNTKGVDFSKRD